MSKNFRVGNTVKLIIKILKHKGAYIDGVKYFGDIGRIDVGGGFFVYIRNESGLLDLAFAFGEDETIARSYDVETFCNTVYDYLYN